MTVWCATGNPGKLREFQLAAQPFGPSVQLEMLPNYGRIEPCEENGGTFEENAGLKAACYGPHAPGLLFADDSGLEVDALNGEPGVRSARYAGEGATDEANNRRLLERLHGIGNRSARFVCVIALAKGSHVLKTFRGVVEGRLLDQPRGAEGFGYDPLFYYEPFGCTFGEVPADRKLVVSHRGQALRAMLEHLQRIEQP